jgi:aryl-alcohol dehydrogenase
LLAQEAVAMSKTYQGVCEGHSNPPEFLPQLLELAAKGKFDIGRISKQYDYKDMEKALHDMKTGEVRRQLDALTTRLPRTHTTQVIKPILVGWN